MKFCSSQAPGQWLKSGLAVLSLTSLLATSLAVQSATPPQAKANSTPSTLLGQSPAIRGGAPTRLPNRIKNAVLQTHARQFRVPISKLRVVSSSRESWSDSCLGLGKPEESCLVAVVNGWRVEVGDGAGRWFYRTDNTGRALRLEDVNNVGSFPQAVGQKVLAIASKELRIPVNQLRVVAGQPRLWDGCLGVAGPEEPCTMIGIPGWQVIVAGPQQYWVYHLNQQATLVKQNPTTSGKGTVVPSFWQPDPGMLPNSSNVVFQSVQSGGIAGKTYKTLLRRDGQVLRIELGPQPPKVPTLIRQLTPEQVQSFFQTLQQNEFGDFLGFNYSTTVGADFFTIALMAPGRKQGVQYVDIAQAQTPAKLQKVIEAWNRIATPDRRS